MSETRDFLKRASVAAPTSEPNLEELYERRDRKARRSRILTATVALVIGLGGVIVALAAIGGHDAFQPGAGDQIGVPTQNLQLGDGEYYYLRFDGGYGVCESWWALDDSGRLNTAVGQPGGSCSGPMGGKIYSPGEFYSDSGPVAELSTDPEELMSQLRERTQPGGASPEPYEDWGGPIEWGLIRSLGELLEAPDVTPAQKAAMLVVASELSTTIDMHAQDPNGRSAILLTLDSEHQTHHWWFDPQSHQPLALDGFVMQAAGITGSLESANLDRSFFHELQP